MIRGAIAGVAYAITNQVIPSNSLIASSSRIPVIVFILFLFIECKIVISMCDFSGALARECLCMCNDHVL